MDGVVRKKQIQEKKVDRGAHAADVQNFLSDSEDHGYHIFELGRSYKKGDDYHERFSGNDPREGVDVRALLEDRESDYDVIESFASNDDESFDEVHEPPFVAEDLSHEKEEQTSFLDELEGEDEIDFDDDGHVRFSLLDVPIFTQQSILHSSHVSRRFAFVGGLIVFLLSFGLFVGTALAVKDRVMDASERAIASMRSALISISDNDLAALSGNVNIVHKEFVYASEEMNKISPVVKFVSRFVPGTSKLSSGSHIVEAGKYLSHTASEFGEIVPVMMAERERVSNGGSAEDSSFLELYQLLADSMSVARYDIAHAQKHIDKVYIDDVPAEYRDSFVQVKELLPQINHSLRVATEARPAVEDLLGANGPRTYLLLFQNNHEMRATGGFIGSYGIVKINKGKIEKMFVDDVYNPDGQLIDRVVPPLPIQKISADWSLHDSNWFVDFPVSARKAMDFYERTGGPTVDGVIAITPSMMEKFLKITGPVDLDDHDIVLTHENFMQVMQDEVEDRDNYIAADEEAEAESQDAEGVLLAGEVEAENPKEALSSLMPVMIERISEKREPQDLAELLMAISEGVKERHIVMYTSNTQMQEIIENAGWSGEVLQTEKDYLSVINTNINGFKTDGVVNESIEHEAEIDADGYIINTVKITRAHEGGHTGYPWWDAVNANYMRLYVPEGSQLLSVEGHTREINEERLDYDALGYERDADVMREESQITIDEETGTRIYNEYGKTVFANWVYVSPQENVTVTYKYRLPFRINFYEDDNGRFGSYAIVFQKQSGSENTSIKSQIVLNNAFEQFWHVDDSDELAIEDDLLIDRYNGAVFRIK